MTIIFENLPQVSFAHVFRLCAIISLISSCAPPSSQITQERKEFAKSDYQSLIQNSVEIKGPLTVDEIIQLAIERNLQLAVQKQLSQVEEEKVKREGWALLPQLNYNFAYSKRNNNSAATDEVLQPFVPPPGPIQTPPIYSISAPKNSSSWNLQFLWNLLDFGVTFCRLQQAQDQAYIQEFQYERVKQSIILQAVTSYWRAVASKRSLERASSLLPDMYAQIHRLKKELKDRQYLTKDQGLAKLSFFYQREIELKGFNDRPDSSDPTQGYAKEYDNAMYNLAQLMQLPPGTHFELYMPEGDPPFEVELPKLSDLYRVGLDNRPELFQQDFQYKITLDDVYIAMIESLPGVNLFAARQHDANRYLLHNDWYQAGVNVVWNLFAIPTRISDLEIGEAQSKASLQNRLYLSESIITQISIAYLLLEQNQEQYLLARRWAEASSAMAYLAQKELKVGKKSKLDTLQYMIDAALAWNNATKIYAELQANIEQLNNAIGIPLYFKAENLGKLNLEMYETTPGTVDDTRLDNRENTERSK